jgi:hypothetical protein
MDTLVRVFVRWSRPDDPSPFGFLSCRSVQSEASLDWFTRGDASVCRATNNAPRDQNLVDGHHSSIFV